MKNKHESDRNKHIAEEGLILLSEVGSGLHGVTVEGTDDHDEMGLCIEPPSCVIGLEKFEQYQWRTQPENVRSGPGDTDHVTYSLRKWTRLAAAGNPTVLLLLFTPPQKIITSLSPWGREVQQAADMFISKQCGYRFLGYLTAQKDRMLGHRSQRTNRPELVDVYGFDTKFAYHAIRLGLQGIELMEQGGIELPIAEPNRTILRDLRTGHYSLTQALDWIDDLHAKLLGLTNESKRPEHPDYQAINTWLISMYQEFWHEKGWH